MINTVRNLHVMIMKTVEHWKPWEQLLNKAMVLFLRPSSGHTSTLSWRKSLEDGHLYSLLLAILSWLLLPFAMFAALSSPNFHFGSALKVIRLIQPYIFTPSLEHLYSNDIFWWLLAWVGLVVSRGESFHFQFSIFQKILPSPDGESTFQYFLLFAGLLFSLTVALVSI